MSSQNPWEFNGDKVLVFSDVHQRLSWMRAVIEKEKNNFDKIVFLGDMFDTHYLETEVSGIKETAKEYASLIENKNNLVLAGNHDIPYLECWSDSKRFTSKKHIFNPCSGFSKSKSIKIAKQLEIEHIEKIRLFAVVNGWILSHAGICKSIWEMANSGKHENESEFSFIYKESLYAMTHLNCLSHLFLAAGRARGGDHPYGGLVWQDWEIEFEDSLPLPQLVGHTYDRFPRQIGRSFCIDTGITYAIIHRDGRLELKNLSALKEKDNNGNLIWVNSEPKTKKLR